MPENDVVEKKEVERLVKRSDKISFMNVGTTDTPNFVRMRKFTDISNSKNPVEYNRQYVDEEGEDTDVTGYSEEIGYAFDQYTHNPVHERIVDITDNELTGDDAKVEILTVDKSKEVSTGVCEARLRTYAVVPDSHGDSTDAYTYSGSFKKKGTFDKVNASISKDGLTAEIVVDTGASN